jgi:putative membrane protein
LLSLAWVKQVSLYPAELDSQAVFAKNWRELDPSLAFAMRHFIFRWLATTLAVMVAASVIHGISYDSPSALILAALLLGILNAFVRPVLLILSAPLILLTLGFFILVVNGLLLWFVPNIVPGFHVDNFGSAFWGAIVIGLVSWMLSAFFRGSDGRVHVLTHHTQIKRVQGRVIEPGDRS